MPTTLSTLAADFLLQMKKGEDATAIVAQLAAQPTTVLTEELRDEDHKKSFWINCYNAFFLYLRKVKGMNKPAIYRQQLCKVAGLRLSLDEIEHGILRRFRLKLGLGYVTDFFVSKTIRELAVAKLDYRIHFALNCGAKSCPPIAFYTAERLNEQLEMASLAFLESETKHDPTHRERHFTRLGQWYLGDFGGYSGIRQIVHERLGLETEGYKLIFTGYDWGEDLDNFV